MSRALITATPNAIAELRALGQRSREYATQAKSQNTRRAYQADLNAFSGWCDERGLCALPAEVETVAAYLTAHAGVLKISTLTRRLTAVREAHRYVGFPLDTSSVAFRDLWRG